MYYIKVSLEFMYPLRMNVNTQAKDISVCIFLSSSVCYYFYYYVMYLCIIFSGYRNFL